MPQVAFVGRSIVGKSSLVNMVLGRKAIAFTSKTPGKTQQYNYFEINEVRVRVRVRARARVRVAAVQLLRDQRGQG